MTGAGALCCPRTAGASCDALVMTTLPPGDNGTVVLRTDFSDERAWKAALDDATTPHPQPDGDAFQALLVTFEDRAIAGWGPEVIAGLPTDGYAAYLFIADARTMLDHTFVVVDLGEERGRWFRCSAGAVQVIENNLSMANMDFSEFADGVGADGVFRGFD